MTIYKIRVNYKSGISETFWCENFEYGSGSYSWKPIYHEGNIKPLLLGSDNVESVWQIDHTEIPDDE